MSAANIAAQADPPIRLLDAAAMDYLLIEAVTALRDSAAVATARAKKIENEMVEAGILPPPPPAKEPKETPRDSMTSISSKTGSKFQPADEEEEALRVRLEAIGMHVGANFSERCEPPWTLYLY